MDYNFDHFAIYSYVSLFTILAQTKTNNSATSKNDLYLKENRSTSNWVEKNIFRFIMVLFFLLLFWIFFYYLIRFFIPLFFSGGNYRFEGVYKRRNLFFVLIKWYWTKDCCWVSLVTICGHQLIICTTISIGIENLMELAKALHPEGVGIFSEYEVCSKSWQDIYKDWNVQWMKLYFCPIIAGTFLYEFLYLPRQKWTRNET